MCKCLQNSICLLRYLNLLNPSCETNIAFIFQTLECNFTNLGEKNIIFVNIFVTGQKIPLSCKDVIALSTFETKPFNKSTSFVKLSCKLYYV